MGKPFPVEDVLPADGFCLLTHRIGWFNTNHGFSKRHPIPGGETSFTAKINNE